MIEEKVGLIGASSFVGERLRLLLEQKGYQVAAFSRQEREGVLPLDKAAEGLVDPIKSWFYLAPIWTLPEHFNLLEAYRAKRLVALSSTSRFTKIDSPSSSDRALVAMLVKGEEEGRKWAGVHGCNLVILQSTLIYGLGKDKNVTEIAKVIKRLGFFPILGSGKGLRQPVHVDDVVSACIGALRISERKSRSYIISGKEVLSYRQMVERIFTGLGRRPRFISCPLFLFSLVVRFLNLLPFYSGPTREMVVRMNKDQIFDHADAGIDLAFTPRAFNPQRLDLE